MKRLFIPLILYLYLFACNTSFSSGGPFYPILEEAAQVNLFVPEEQRDEKYIRFLCVSVRVSVNGSAGSGTICHFDESEGWAYVISCGHLWSGNKQYNPKRPEKARITTWYQNSVKLESPRSYDAEALFWSNDRGRDVSLLRFKPDWNPTYAHFASDLHEKKGLVLNSMGCDGGKEVARYEVVFLEMNAKDLIAGKNSPRPGRSGGGLLTEEGEIVGVCWGSSDIETGSGIGYFTPLKSIREVFSENDHSWLIDTKRELDLIPILDWDDPDRKYDRRYVPFPLPL